MSATPTYVGSFRIVLISGGGTWNDFDWDDYLEHCHFTETFNMRHLLVKNGLIRLTEDDLKPPPIRSKLPHTIVTATSMTTKTDRTRRKTVHTTVCGYDCLTNNSCGISKRKSGFLIQWVPNHLLLLNL